MYEYKIVPAPKKGLKAKGLKSPEDRFSHALCERINSEARDGWEFLRAETLPSEERSGFRSSTIVYRSVLVFRKARTQAEELAEVPAPVVPTGAPAAPPQPLIAEEDSPSSQAGPDPDDQDNSSAKA